MPPAADCPFCTRLAEGQVTIGEDLAAAFPDGFPVSTGHSLVVPRRHVSDFFQLTVEERASVWSVVAAMKARLDREHSPAGYNVGVNVGAAGGQTVWHAHVHLIPRYQGDVEDPKGGVRWVVRARAPYWKERK